jgi:signal transduction histidine kinase
MARFSVDTHLFRELGELLVGRDSTALVELVKNAYDADATVVTVWGDALRSGSSGVIKVDDDGTGMTPAQFENGFLRIASRSKETADRRSSRFQRRFTGAKGIGRLAAHKLSKILKLSSVPWVAKPTSDRQGVEAEIRWDKIEAYETLQDIESTARAEDLTARDAHQKARKPDPPLVVTLTKVPVTQKSGTHIELHTLRRKWSDAELTRFLAEIQSFQPPPFLVNAPSKKVVKSKPLFETALVRDSSSADPGFRVALEGEFSGSDEYWKALLDSASWVVEVDVAPKQKVKVLISPTERTLARDIPAAARNYGFEHPDPIAGPFFHCRILVRDGPLSAPKVARTWLRATTGVRIFMEGFRVLPYGEPRNDWLGLDADYTRRVDDLPALSKASLTSDRVEEEGFSLLPNANYFGAVFLTEERAQSLQMLVNREGFVPNDSFHHLVSIVRTAIDLSTRVRAASTVQSRADRRAARQDSKHGAVTKSQQEQPAPTSTRGRIDAPADEASSTAAAAVELTQQAKQLAARGQHAAAAQQLSRAVTLFQDAITTYQLLRRDEAMLRVLASVGTQMGSFIHEVRGLLGIAQAADAALARIRESSDLPRTARNQLGTVHATLVDLRQSLERHASYLTDIVTPDARRRRSRLPIGERFASAVRLVDRTAARRGIDIQATIPESLRTPPMFPAELTTVFSNLLTNAVKAAGEKGKIRATAGTTHDGSIRVLVENTGQRVSPEEGERWFQPFESTTTDIDPVLGQGMGLGLPITRSILEQYGADIRFASPTAPPYVTAVEIVFRD